MDFVQTDWSANQQRCVAQAHLIEDHIKFIERRGHGWEMQVMQPYFDQGSRSEIDPQRDPEVFLERISQALSGTTFFATDLHDDAHCPFAAADVISFRRPATPLQPLQ